MLLRPVVLHGSVQFDIIQKIQLACEDLNWSYEIAKSDTITDANAHVQCLRHWRQIGVKRILKVADPLLFLNRLPFMHYISQMIPCASAMSQPYSRITMRRRGYVRSSHLQSPVVNPISRSKTIVPPYEP